MSATVEGWQASLAAALILLFFGVFVSANPTLYSDGNISTMQWSILGRHFNGSVSYGHLLNFPTQLSNNDVAIGLNRTNIIGKDLFASGGFGAISAVQTLNSGGWLYGGANFGSADLRFNTTMLAVNYYNKSEVDGLKPAIDAGNVTSGTMDYGRLGVPDCSGTQYLTSNSTFWYCDSPAGAGTVTNVSAGMGMSFPDITGFGVVSIDPSIVVNHTKAAADYVSRSDWTTHDDYPAACSVGQYVTQIGDTLTCSTPPGTYDDTALWANASNQDSRIISLEGDVTDLWSNASNQDGRIITMEGYLNQGVKTTDSPTFNNLTLNNVCFGSSCEVCEYWNGTHLVKESPCGV